MRDHIQSAIDRVAHNAAEEWKEQYLILARQFLEVHEIFEGGMLKEHCKARGLPDPHSHNVWGAMVRGLSTARGWTEKYPDLLLATRGGHYMAPAIDAGPEDPLLCWPPAMRLAEIVRGRV